MLGGKVQSISLRGVFLDNWLLKIERKAFGWNFEESRTEEDGLDIDWERGKVRQKYCTVLEFRRKAPYSHNFFFCLTEFFSRILSFIRRFIALFIVPLIIIGLILGVVTMVACENAAETSQMLFTTTGAVAAAYVGALVIPSLILAGIGFMWRKIFKIDERLIESLRMHGYNIDLSDCTFAGEYDD